MSVIQGQADADVGGKLTQELVTKTIEFCFHAYDDISTEGREAVMEKLDGLKADPNAVESKEDLEKLTEDERVMLRTIRARQMLRTDDMMNIDNFSQDAVDGFVPRIIRGQLGLAKASSGSAGRAYAEGLFDAIRDLDGTLLNINTKPAMEGVARAEGTKA